MQKVYSATIEIPCEDAEIIKKSLEVENEHEFSVNIYAEKNKLVIKIEANRISMLQAGINSYLRAIKSLI
ncbi:MAG TPA: hypothetical protein EYH56_03795 [Nanoarchaeota archaeon]|nr:hypothetical protein [Nanoarchaeota archaeon]